MLFSIICVKESILCFPLSSNPVIHSSNMSRRSFFTKADNPSIILWDDCGIISPAPVRYRPEVPSASFPFPLFLPLSN